MQPCLRRCALTFTIPVRESSSSHSQQLRSGKSINIQPATRQTELAAVSAVVFLLERQSEAQFIASIKPPRSHRKPPLKSH